jgi:plasmid stabilization system protein ParE
MATLSWTDEAQLWLRDIHDFIAADSPAAAERVVLEIHACAQLLREHPRLGQRYWYVTDREVRILLYGHYRIAYLIDADSGNIDVLGVFHGALPIERYLL